MLHENRESVPFREVEPDTGFPIYAFFSHFRFWMASGCKSDWSIHYIWLQIKRLNAEIETLGANLTEVMQKENDTANQVSLCDNQTTSTRKILMIGLLETWTLATDWSRRTMGWPVMSSLCSWGAESFRKCIRNALWNGGQRIIHEVNEVEGYLKKKPMS